MVASRTFSLIFAAAALCHLLPSVASKTLDLATAVCSNTTDVAFCCAAVYSDPLAAGADRYDLADIVFRLAYSNASDTRDYIADAAGGGGGLKKCLKDYEKAVEIVGTILNDLNSEMYSYMDVRSVDVDRYVRHCRKELGVKEWGSLVKRNQNMLKLANICYVVSKLFRYQ